MPAHTRNPIQREHDRAKIEELYCQGVRQAEIAQKIHLSPRMVSYDLVTIQKRWEKSTTINLDDAKARELAKIDNLERVYWDAWEKSWETKESTETGQDEVLAQAEKVLKGALGKRVARIRREERLGVAEYLKGVQWCIEIRCKLLTIIKEGTTSPWAAAGMPPLLVRTMTIVEPLPNGRINDRDAIEGSSPVLDGGGS